MNPLRLGVGVGVLAAVPKLTVGMAGPVGWLMPQALIPTNSPAAATAM